MPDKTAVGMRLRAYRKAKGVSRDTAAAEIGISSAALGMYELGARTPRDEVKWKSHRTMGTPCKIYFCLKVTL